MRSDILMMLLAVVSSSAAAEWVEVYPHDENFTNYADPASIRKAGDLVKMWSLGDRKMPSDKYMSFKYQIEYDCKKEQYRWLDTSYHSGRMGVGAGSHPNPGRPYWKPVRRRSGSLFEALWMFACAKR